MAYNLPYQLEVKSLIRYFTLYILIDAHLKYKIILVPLPRLKKVYFIKTNIELINFSAFHPIKR